MKKTEVKLGLLAVAAFFLLSGQTGCAATDTPPPVEKDRFIEMDVNRDGNVSLEEFTAANPNMTSQAFVIIDRDKSNGIDRIEWAEFAQDHARPAPQRGAPMNNIPGDPLIPPPDSSDLPLMRPPMN